MQIQKITSGAAGENTFYPTPQALADKMLAGIDFDYVQSVLEPSAGKGDLAEAVLKKWSASYRHWQNKKAPWDLDCIEADPNLRFILKGKGLRVVGDDFFTHQTYKRYSLIVMNPPFDRGAEHLLKALEVQKNGGTVICLLNAETILNPRTNTRDLLARKLKQYEASIDYIDDAFKNAERSTHVRIALVKVTVPEVERESIILDNLRKATVHQDAVETEPNELSAGNFIQSIVDQYDFEVQAGISLIREWEAMSPYIKRKINGEGILDGDPILRLTMTRDRDYGNDSVNANEFIGKVRCKYWEALFQNPKFIEKLTSNLREDLYARVEELAGYDFSLFNIMQLQLEMSSKVIAGIEETILKLFEDLTHTYHWDNYASNRHYFDGWATNEAWRVGKRIVLPNVQAFSDYGTRKFRPNDYSVSAKLSDIEKAFDYLDGSLTGAADIRDILKMAEDDGQTGGVSFKYFDVTFYKKGTAHLTFTNQDVLHKFNLFAARKKQWLPPSYGKKRYKDMSAQERTVVDSFEGEASYNVVMARPEYFLQEIDAAMPLMIGDSNEINTQEAEE